jgi:large repetitive protein
LATGTYFASQTVGGCESDTRLEVAVTVNDPSAPTGSATQSFCSIDNPTVADLAATGTAIQWYTTASGGTPIDPTTALTTGTYFASQTVGGCESDTRLEVAVTVIDPAAPTGSATQTFCSIDNPTVADLAATGTSIQWYATASGGTPIDPSTALTTGTYFASQTVGGCESDERLEVAVTVNDPSAPTGSATQSFCSIDNPTVADLAATGTSIQWYATASGGTAIDPSTALATGTYFASQTVGGCESDERLEVAVLVNNLSFQILVNAVPNCGSANGQLTVQLTEGTAPFDYVWSTGATTATITNCSAGTYTVEVTDVNACSFLQSITIDCEIANIPEIITPNGNGQNDTWVIGFKDKYPDVSVSIYNRWGNEVYFSSPYEDDWDGKANKGAGSSDGYLPSGTYYYIIDKKNGEKPLTGFIELVK